MKAIIKRALPALLLACAASANASVIDLGSVDKNYGSATGYVNTNTGVRKPCDKMGTNAVTVKDTPSGCTWFNDVFDFSALGTKNIDSFDLTLTFSNTNDSFVLGPTRTYEDWRVQVGDSATSKSAVEMDLLNSLALTTQTFHIDAASHADVFANIAANGKFYLSFRDDSWLSSDFILRSASLKVNGIEAADVPEPSSIALFGVAMLGAAYVRRRRAAK